MSKLTNPLGARDITLVTPLKTKPDTYASRMPHSIERLTVVTRHDLHQ